VILRLASVYGPFEPLPKAITDFLRVAARGDQISLTGDGSALRDYIYVSDAAQACLRAVGWSGQGVFNVAHPERLSLRQLAGVALETCGSGSVGFAEPGRRLRDRVMDVRLMEEVFGFRCSVDARTGLAMVAREEAVVAPH
jgi:nucleoside-diphosphate-sugar epimerase